MLTSSWITLPSKSGAGFPSPWLQSLVDCFQWTEQSWGYRVWRWWCPRLLSKRHCSFLRVLSLSSPTCPAAILRGPSSSPYGEAHKLRRTEASCQKSCAHTILDAQFPARSSLQGLQPPPTAWLQLHEKLWAGTTHLRYSLISDP